MDHQTIAAYNALAKEYDEDTAEFWELFPRTFFDAFTKLGAGRILDIGSGPGRDALVLKDAGLEVVCLDASESMINLCRERGLEAHLGDFLSLPFPNESFDGAWAYTSFLHVPKDDILRAFKETARILQPGGYLGLGMIEGDSEGYKETSGIQQSRYFSFYSKEELEKHLTDSGFSVVYFESFVAGKNRPKNYLNFIAVKT